MIDLFGNEVVQHKLIDRDILTGVLIQSLRGITETELVSLLYSKYEAIIDFSRLCYGEKTGEKISMIFNPHRYATPTKRGKSIIDFFKDDAFLSGIARVTLFKDGKYRDEELLYQVLQLGVNGSQYVNEFPPHIARDFFISFHAKRILDPCAGWGGRMIGAASVDSFYHGFEPSTKTYNGLIELGLFLKSFKNGFDFRIENKPFEDAVLVDSYDLALTSPPYYDTEIYSDESTQSCNRYKTFTEWCNGFYLPMIEKVLKHSGKFVLNVGSRGYDLKGVMMKLYPAAREVNSKLSGKGGLGREDSGKEAFYLLENH
jgi:hypothetical protein